MISMDVIHDYWAILLSAVAYLFWLARLEMKVLQNSKDIDQKTFNATKDLRDLETRLSAQRAEDMASRQRDWDSMHESLNGIQGDIKELLQRTVK